jgi:hypothetical protein
MAVADQQGQCVLQRVVVVTLQSGLGVTPEVFPQENAVFLVLRGGVGLDVLHGQLGLYAGFADFADFVNQANAKLYSKKYLHAPAQRSGMNGSIPQRKNFAACSGNGYGASRHF